MTTERRSTERLLADARQRLALTASLPNQIEEIRGWAQNREGTVRVSTTVHGALVGLNITPEALALGPHQLAAQIVALAGAANREALIQGVGELSHALGDKATAELADTMGLGDHLDPPAPVLPYVPGADPNASQWTALDAPPPPEDDALSFDFSSLRSDR